MIIDTHVHYNLEPFFLGWQEHWQKAQEHGVEKSIVVGTDLETSQRALQIAQTEKNLFAAVGIHPGEIMQDKVFEKSFAELSDKINEKVVAIGETGLDYFHLENDAQKTALIAAQQNHFRAHIRLAKNTHLPLIIHVRDREETAYWDVLRILEEENFSGKYILHCVSGPLPYIKKALKMGAFCSIAGNITYKNAQHIREIVDTIPADRLLLETDAPFLPPQEFRGKPCEPWMISLTAAYVEKELRVDLAQVAENAQLFLKKLNEYNANTV
jgi:TatD DNase family protein